MLCLLRQLQTNFRVSSAMVMIHPVQCHNAKCFFFVMPSTNYGASTASRRTCGASTAKRRTLAPLHSFHNESLSFHEEYKRRYRLKMAGKVHMAELGEDAKTQTKSHSDLKQRKPIEKKGSKRNEGNEAAELTGEAPTHSIGTAMSSPVVCGPEVMYDLQQVDQVGEKTAQMIYDEFGHDTVNVLNLEPKKAVSKLRTVNGIGPVKAGKIKKDWDAGASARALASELLNTYGLDFVTARELVGMMKKKVDVNVSLDKDPYLTLLKANPQVSFQSIDAFAVKRLGEEQAKSHPSRVCAAVIDELKLANVEQHHSCLPWHELKTSAKASLGYAPQDEEAEQWMVDSIVAFMSRLDMATWDLMICIGDQDTNHMEPGEAGKWGDDALCYLKVRLDEEDVVCDSLVRLIKARGLKGGSKSPQTLQRQLQKKYPDRFDFEGLSEGQKQALRMALSSNVVVITGWPGTGKTFCMRFILACVLEQMGIDLNGEGNSGHSPVGVCAPTGRAASNLQEKLGLPVDSKTVHRLLQVKFNYGYKSNEEGWGGREFFRHNQYYPLRHNFVGIDETSMIDTSLFASLLGAIEPGSRVYLIGDPNQLPPVRSGQVLQDIIDSGIVPVVELRQIFRQAMNSTIAMNAHAFLKNQMPSFEKVALQDFDKFPSKLGSDCVWLEVPDGAKAELQVKRIVMDLIQKIPRPGDVQVVSCTKMGDAGTVRLNTSLQSWLNPQHPSKAEGRFEMLDHGTITVRVCDKVIQCKNDYRKGVYNGDMGEVEAVHQFPREEVEVRYMGRQSTVVYSRDMLKKQLQPAWALTVHRSQGAEFPIVVMPVVPGKAGNSKKMFYTAMTRPTERLIIVGTKAGLHECLTTETESRYSGMKLKLESLRKAHGLKKIEPVVFD